MAAGHLGVAADDPASVPWLALSTGYVCVVTRDLLWQPVPERPASWSVHAVARTAAAARAPR